LQNVVKGEYDTSNDAYKVLSDDAKDIISKILVLDFKKRPTGYQIS